jgi:putative acetyltransferase
MMTIRPERLSDIEAIRAVNRAAFDTGTEATLVDRLREEVSPIVSLVADDEGKICGHILFSFVALADDSLRIMGLAPMAVVPDRQRQGIGSMLVRTGLHACRELDVQAVVVLGHAAYYPRFGFRPASQLGIRGEYDVPDDVFMALELEPGALLGKSGVVRYHSAFSEV